MSKYELEWRLIYSLIVAGKSAKFAEAVMARLIPEGWYPFRYLMQFCEKDLEKCFRDARTGNYRKLCRAIPIVVREIDPKHCTIEELEAVPGIGPKTSRFFLLWTRPDIRVAALDRHILRWLRKQGYNAPKNTPTKKKYRELEKAFLAEADKRGMTPRDLDYQIWVEYSGYEDDMPLFQH